MKVISFSLWGKDPMYLVGALKNIELAKVWYPGWECFFHCDETVPMAVLRDIAYAGGRVVVEEPLPGFLRLFWRFIAPVGTEAIIARDADSRLGEREAWCVAQWLESPAEIGVIRDHPNHKWRIMGGMWGHRGHELLSRNIMFDVIRNIMDGNYPEEGTGGWIGPGGEDPYFGVDQIYLQEKVWGNCTAMVHDEFGDGLPIPIWRKDRSDFIGNKYREDDTPIYTLESR